MAMCHTQQPLFPYAVQCYDILQAVWRTVSSYEAYGDACRAFERLVKHETDPERCYRVLRTEVVNMIIRQS